MVLLIIFVLLLSHSNLISPIKKLTDQIVNPNKSDEMAKFIKKIQDQTMREKREKEKDSQKKKWID